MPGITQGVKLGLRQSLEAPAPLWPRPQKDMLVGGLVLCVRGRLEHVFSPEQDHSQGRF